MTRITVIVVDDHDLLREGVSACLARFDDLEVVGEAGSGEAALTVVADLQPDVVVMDLVMPGIGGVEAIRQLRATHDGLGIVALSSFSDAERVREVIDAGANGYLVKSVDAESLALAVRSAAAGHGIYSPQVTRSLLDRADAAESLAVDVARAGTRAAAWPRARRMRRSPTRSTSVCSPSRTT